MYVLLEHRANKEDNSAQEVRTIQVYIFYTFDNITEYFAWTTKEMVYASKMTPSGFSNKGNI